MAQKQNLMRIDRIGYAVGGLALIVWALRRPSVLRGSAAGIGAWLLHQAYTGANPLFRPLGIRVNRAPGEIGVQETLVVEEAVTISRPRAEVFEYWSAPTHLPRALDAETEVARAAEGELVAWRGMRAGRLAHFGSIELRDAPGGRGTIVAARLEYMPHGGSLGAALSSITGRAPQRVLADTLRRARALLETGESPTTEGQSAGSR